MGKWRTARMIKECATIQDYNETLNEYYKYHHNRWGVGDSESGSKFLITGVSFKIVNKEQYRDEEIREIFNHNVSILNDTLPLLGRYCKCDDREGEFIGIEATEEDFYYMLRHSDGSIDYCTCCGGIEDKFPNIEYNGGEEKKS